MEAFAPTRLAVHVLPEGELERKLKEAAGKRFVCGVVLYDGEMSAGGWNYDKAFGAVASLCHR